MPSSSVGFGQSTASIDQLLAAGSESTSEEGANTEEAPSRGEAVDAADADGIDGLATQFANGMPIGSRSASRSASAGASRDRSQDQSRRSSAADPMETAALPMDMQTPRNEYFLSSLAPAASSALVPVDGMPGMHQQLDLAEGSNGNGVSAGVGGSASGIGAGSGAVETIQEETSGSTSGSSLGMEILDEGEEEQGEPAGRQGGKRTRAEASGTLVE